MATENPVNLLSGLVMGGGLGDGLRSMDSGRQDAYYDGYAKELGHLLKDRARFEMGERQRAKERELFGNRSGSAPPSVEGSLAAMGGLVDHYAGYSKLPPSSGNGVGSLEAEERLRSDPAYLSYYYSHVNLNPRLPPPLVSRENWRLAQRLGAIRDKGNVRPSDDSNSRSLFSSQPVRNNHNEEAGFLAANGRPSGNLGRQKSSEWGDGAPAGLIGLSPLGLEARRKSFADVIQEDISRTPSSPFHQSRPARQADHDDGEDMIRGMDAQLVPLHSSSSSAFTSTELQIAAGLSSRSTTPKPNPSGHSAVSSTVTNLQSADAHQGTQRSVPPVSGGCFGMSGQPFIKRPLSRTDSLIAAGNVINASGIAAALQSLNFVDTQDAAALEEYEQSEQHLQQESREQHDQLLHLQKSHQLHQQQAKNVQPQGEAVSSSVYSQAIQQLQQQQQQLQFQAQVASLQPALQTGAFTPNMYAAAAAAMSYIAGGSPYYQNPQLASMNSPHYGLGGYPVTSNLVPSMMMGYASSGTFPVGLESAAMAAAIAASMEARKGATGTPDGGVNMQHLYGFAGQLGASLQPPAFDPLYFQYLQQVAQDAQVASALNDVSSVRGYMGRTYGDFLSLQKSHGSLSGLGLGVFYSSNPHTNAVLPSSPVSSTSPLRQSERSPHLPSGGSSRSAGGVVASRQSEQSTLSLEGSNTSLLEEFKSNKSRCFELPDIFGQVVDFSVDQHGSRFIQQKLEVARPEEQDMLFKEILPQALTLMTDVFGNYVIQKFFEHGTPQQRRDLGNHITGHVLSLSLQMYGCRVIQKAIEVVDVDQQTQLVSELDGHVMRCVRDQNGNHVIQKCIECVPEERIQFIICAFLGQVVALSTHPYGCRVIQRILEHCANEQTQHCVLEEILRSACNLAQDQYGNYVVQHVLEHGKPKERCEIIKMLAGQIVQMSQHKFASNVIEKCLEFGGHIERQIMITEILGDTDENAPLQAMMKDQFANYVVQKVLETCDDMQREILLARIKVHLHALKKYTYGKHIVTRVEKLVATGERRSGANSNHRLIT